MSDLVKYYRAGGPCEDFNDVCRHRLAGCPCTETADRIEELERDNRNRGAAVVLAQEYLAEKDKRIVVLEGALKKISRWGCIAPEDQQATVDIARAALKEKG